MIFDKIKIPNVGMIFPFKKLNIFNNSSTMHNYSNYNVVDSINPTLEHARVESVPQTVIMRPERIEATVVEPKIVMEKRSFHTNLNGNKGDCYGHNQEYYRNNYDHPKYQEHRYGESHPIILKESYNHHDLYNHGQKYGESHPIIIKESCKHHDQKPIIIKETQHCNHHDQKPIIIKETQHCNHHDQKPIIQPIIIKEQNYPHSQHEPVVIKESPQIVVVDSARRRRNSTSSEDDDEKCKDHGRRNCKKCENLYVMDGSRVYRVGSKRMEKKTGDDEESTRFKYINKNGKIVTKLGFSKSITNKKPFTDTYDLLSQVDGSVCNVGIPYEKKVIRKSGNCLKAMREFETECKENVIHLTKQTPLHGNDEIIDTLECGNHFDFVVKRKIAYGLNDYVEILVQRFDPRYHYQTEQLLDTYENENGKYISASMTLPIVTIEGNQYVVSTVFLGAQSGNTINEANDNMIELLGEIILHGTVYVLNNYNGEVLCSGAKIYDLPDNIEFNSISLELPPNSSPIFTNKDLSIFAKYKEQMFVLMPHALNNRNQIEDGYVKYSSFVRIGDCAPSISNFPGRGCPPVINVIVDKISSV